MKSERLSSAHDLRALCLLSVIWAVSLVVCVSVGALTIPLGVVSRILTPFLSLPDVDSAMQAVVLSIRLPRVLLAAVVGGTLAVAGASLQGVFRNPLADPGLIGVSSGAAAGVVSWIVFGGWIVAQWPALMPLKNVWMLPVTAFMGGIVTTSVVVRLSRRGDSIDISTMLLAGIAINAFAGALIGVAVFASNDQELRTLTMWSLGSLGGATWQILGIITAVVALPLIWLLRQSADLDLVVLGEREAGHLGVDVPRLHRGVVAASALLVGASVGFTGLIGFVGLVVPHLLRLLGGPHHRWIMPGSFVLGGILLAVSDLFSRTLVAPAELPIGVVTSLFGAPFFVLLLLRSKSRGHA